MMLSSEDRHQILQSGIMAQGSYKVHILSYFRYNKLQNALPLFFVVISLNITNNSNHMYFKKPF